MTTRRAQARRPPASWWLAAPAVAAAGAVVAATGKGLYVSPDAVFYVGSARNLVDGRGLTPPAGLPPVGHFPPLFTLILAAIGKLGLDPLDAARVTNALAVGAIVVLVGLAARRLTGSPAAALVAAVLVAAAVDLLALSGSALSEPLFIALTLAGLLALAAHLDHGRPVWSLLVAAGLVGAAVLTRYVGVAVVVAGVVALVRFGENRRGHGVVDAAVFGAIAMLPVTAFVAWAGRAEGATGDRHLAWHAVGGDYLGQAARPLARWLLPWPRPPLGLALAVVVGAGIVVLVRRLPAAAPACPTSALPWLLGALVLAYLALLVADRVLADASGRLDARFLAPIHAALILLAVPALYRRQWPAWAVLLAGGLVVAQVAGAVAWTAGGLDDRSIRRRGYTAPAWRTSAVVAQINGAPGPVYSNGFDAIVFLTGREATPIPATKDYQTGRPNPRYQEQLAAMERTGGLLAYFDVVTARRSFLPTRQELEHALPLSVVTQDAVGTLYRIR